MQRHVPQRALERSQGEAQADVARVCTRDAQQAATSAPGLCRAPRLCRPRCAKSTGPCVCMRAVCVQAKFVLEDVIDGVVDGKVAVSWWVGRVGVVREL